MYIIGLIVTILKFVKGIKENFQKIVRKPCMKIGTKVSYFKNDLAIEISL
jgi:hypothetical protein